MMHYILWFFNFFYAELLAVLVTISTETANGEAPWKKLFLKNLQNPQKNPSARASFLVKLQAETCNFIKKETLTQVFPCECCVTFKNNFFTEQLRPTASVWITFNLYYPVDTGHKLNVHKTFRRRPGRLLNVVCTFSLRPTG